jgi:putative ABC transport system substrate-binding protein
MNRREVVGALGAAALASCNAFAQAGKVPRIGALVSGAAGHPFGEAFGRGLAALGYRQGESLAVDYRYTDGKSDRAAELAAELVKLNVDVIVAHLTPAVKAAMAATKTIPIVMAPAGAPLQTGFVASLARPGGNVTGLSAMDAEIGGKRLQLWREIIPNLSCLAVLASSIATDPYSVPYVADLRAAADAASVRFVPILIDGAADFERAFSAMSKEGAQGVVVQPLFDPSRSSLLEVAAKYSLAVMSASRETTAAGGLISLSANFPALYERAALYVDHILKGAKPADLPVGQPTTFQIVINMRTAKALNLNVSLTLLAQADEVIE